MPIRELQQMVHASLMAALIALGAYTCIPFWGPVPLVLQNLFVFLAGLLLGSRWGLAAMGIYLLVGAIGMPVFSGGRGGLAHFMGPTGGYLIGFAAAAWLAGLISERSPREGSRDIPAVVAGVLVVHLFGVPWLKAVTGMSWEKAFLAGAAPFILGDALKACAAVVLARAVRPVIRRRVETAVS